MYSYHPDQGALGRGECYTPGWQPADDRSLTSALLGWATSPILFDRGHRGERYFLAADWVGLDFDEGPSMDEIYKTFCDCIHVIGTTRSHRKVKNGKPPCDRFRLWLKLTDTITIASSYKATVRLLVHRYDADPACVGAAQLFWPCTELTSVLFEGDTTDVVVAEEKSYAQVSTAYTGRIPYWVRDWLNGKIPTNTRNFHVFKVAVWLTQNGWPEPEILSLVMSSSLVRVGGGDPMPDREIKKAVRSGMERAFREVSR